MSKLTDEQAMAIGRAVHKELCKPGQWPKLIFAELFDHKRRLGVSSYPDRVLCSDPHEEAIPTEIKFPGMYPLESE